jgi:hypothetical protein
VPIDPGFPSCRSQQYRDASITASVKISCSVLLRVDRLRISMHFWDPMTNGLTPTDQRALNSAAASRAGAIFMITAIMTTTRKRGVSG